MITALDALLFVVALLIMGMGFSRRADLWQRGREETCPGDLTGCHPIYLGHGRILLDRKRGLPHLILVAGTVIPLLAVIVAQFGLQFPVIPVRPSIPGSGPLGDRIPYLCPRYLLSSG